MKTVTLKPAIWTLGTIALLTACSDQSPPLTGEAQTPAPAEEVAADRLTVDIANAMSGWLHSGLEIKSGDNVALIGRGIWEADGLTLEPRHLLWYRIGEQGTARNFAADVEVFTADADGDLFLTLRPIGVYWDDDAGTYPAEFAEAPPIPVEITVEAIRFEEPMEVGLTSLATAGDSAAQRALTTLAERRTLPDGFYYLPYLGRSNVWMDGTKDGRPGIQAATRDDVGIVKLPLDVPLTEDTRFNFEWRYDSLPALGPETEPQFHDYLSIALEFDNGQDLTWMWSPELEAGTHFGCPLPWWDSRETHWVLTKGRDGLGEWHQHTREVLADYRASIQLSEPARIVGVWFIANSIFGRQQGAASFANVKITNGDTETVIFGD
ncbi:MAG: DUF3047 domain-containing protein [Pseudomonadales bacterium]